VAQRSHAVVEAGNVHPAVAVVEGREQLTQDVGGIGDRAAEHAAVEVVARAGDGYLGVNQAAQPAGDSGDAAGELVGVADDADVGAQVSNVRADERLQIVAAAFLLAL